MPGLNCREYEMDLMDLARRRPLDAATRARLSAHVESCARCRHVLDSQVRLSAAAEVVADEASRWSAPFCVEQAVVAKMRMTADPRRRRYVYGLAGAALAASLMVAWVANRPAAKKPEVANAVVAPVIVSTQPVEQPFIAIPYAAPLEPYERADVVRMNLPVTALIAAGVPVEVADPSARAQTDVLVGQDGRARAVRLVSISMLDYQGVNAQ